MTDPASLPYPRIISGDFAASLRFYADLLGVPPAKEHPGAYAHFELDGETRLALLDRAALGDVVPLGDPTGPSRDTLVLVLRVSDVDAALARLAEQGVTPTVAAADRPGWGLRSAYLRDPDGNLLELQQY